MAGYPPPSNSHTPPWALYLLLFGLPILVFVIFVLPNAK